MRNLYRNFETQAQIDAQYNPSIGLPAGVQPMQQFAAQALQARSELRSILDVPYGPTLEETLDIFPADTANAPVFIFLHGGYWRALSSKDFSGIARGLQSLGITTVVVNYALCPFVSIDEITRQTRAACAWVLRNIGAHGGDPSRVALGGHSAGGHLTAMCLQTQWKRDYGLPQDPFSGALLFSGLYDLEPLRYSYLQPLIQLDDGVIRRNSPAFLMRACATPIWITWGGSESAEFARQSELYRDAFVAAGNQALLTPQPGANHFTVLQGFERADSPVCQWVAKTLRA